MPPRRSGRSTAITRTFYQPAPRASPAPIIRVVAPRSVPTVHRKKPVRHRGRKAHHGGTLDVKHAGGAALAGFIVGKLEAMDFIKALPRLPYVGMKGTIALGAYILNKQGIGGTYSRDVCIAAATCAGYQFGKEDKIDGEDDDD
jgi:hypothetical protein